MLGQEKESQPQRLLSRLSWKSLALISTTTTAFAAVLLLSVGFAAAVSWLPYPSDAVIVPEPCTQIEDRTGESLGTFVAASDQLNIPLAASQISPHLLDAIVAIEDRRFFTHHGVDWRSVIGAAWEDALRHSEHRGASTITMQLYRLSHPQHRSIWAKLMQAVRAEQIEARLSKREILVDYANSAPFGGNLLGAGAASCRYFGKPCKDLSLAESAMLAGLLKDPKELRPDRFPQRAVARRNIVLNDMLASAMIDQAERDRAVAEPADAQWFPLPQFCEGLNNTIAGPYNPLGLLPLLTELAHRDSGKTVRTTIDLETQRQAAERASQTLRQFAPSHIRAVAVVVLETQTANCLASVSLSTSWHTDMIDLTERPRSSGSTLKPFIYAAAFEEGICTPQTVLNDSPTSWSGYAPNDYDREFTGPIRAADALAQSRNVPAMALLSKVGVGRTVKLLSNAGLKTLSKHPLQYGLPLAIGGADVTPMELAEAYATLARGGVHRRATILKPSEQSAIADTDHAAAPKRFSLALRAESCRAVLHCLSDPDRTEQVCPSAVALHPAWKTGTSSGHRDAWCAAVTPRRTVIVWLGNADGTGSDALIGQDAAAPLALEILSAIDPGGDGFTPAPQFRVDAQHASAELAAGSDRIEMISPVSAQEIVRDPSLASSQQRVSLNASGPNAQHLWWFVDQTLVGECASGLTLWWNPTPGSHVVRVVAGDGQSAFADITVR